MEFAGLFVGLFSTRQCPVKDKPARARIPRERRLLFGGRVNPEPVDLSFRHLISRSLRVDIFGNRGDLKIQKSPKTLGPSSV